MKLLLDECVNQKLRAHLVGHEAFTVGFLGWDGLKNGELLQTAVANGFDALLTIDQAMPSQHNPATLPLIVVILQPASDQLPDLIALIPELNLALAELTTPTFVRVP